MTVQPKIIVVAEDETLIRMMAVEALIAAGFEVIEAGHAEAALAILNVQADRIHVLFTDVNMPGEMNGIALAHHARRHWPWIALLVASGRAVSELEQLPDGSRFLPKPYETDHILSHMQVLVPG